jgi:hypothetical protein
VKLYYPAQTPCCWLAATLRLLLVDLLQWSVESTWCSTQEKKNMQ